MLKYGEHVRKACKMHAECMHFAVTTRYQLKQLHTYYPPCVYCYFHWYWIFRDPSGARSGCVRGAFGVRSESIRGAFATRAGIFSTFRFTLQVYLRCPGSLYRCIYDVPGHFTGVFTISRVTLQVYSRYPIMFAHCNLQILYLPLCLVFSMYIYFFYIVFSISKCCQPKIHCF